MGADSPSYLLIVDDDDDWRASVEMAIRYITKKRSVSIQSFASHLEAEKFVRSNSGAIKGCILDIQLGEDLDGVDFFNQTIYPLAPQAKVLFLSGLFEQSRIGKINSAAKEQIQFSEKGDFSNHRQEKVDWLLEPLS